MAQDLFAVIGLSKNDEMEGSVTFAECTTSEKAERAKAILEGARTDYDFSVCKRERELDVVKVGDTVYEL